MAIRIPKNQIQYKYTQGKEYMYKDTYREYQGHYYELNNQIFAGKEFNSNAPVLVRIPKGNNDAFNGFNSLLTRASTYVYGRISGTKIRNPKPVTQVFKNDPNLVNVTTNRYFVQNTNITPILIKEVTEESFNQLKTNPLYKAVSIRWIYNEANENQIENAEKIIPGIKTYLEAEESEGDAYEGNGSSETVPQTLPPQQLFDLSQLELPQSLSTPNTQSQVPVPVGPTYIINELPPPVIEPGTLNLVLTEAGSPVQINSPSAWSSFFGLSTDNYFTEVEIILLPQPSGVNYRSVTLKGGRITSIPKFTFQNNNSLYSITDIANQITTIGQNAFDNCSELKNASFLNLITIENYAFANCFNLTTMYCINLITIGNGAFSSCSSLFEIKSPNNATSVGDNAFDGCNNLQGLDLNNAITIGDSAITNMEKLYTVNIRNCTSLGDPNLTNLIPIGELPNAPGGKFTISYKSTVNNIAAIDNLEVIYGVGNVDKIIYP